MITRKEFYALLWSTPLTSILKHYNLTYTQVRKICKDMDIPTPRVGHWEKLKAHKGVILVKLPEFNGPEEIELNVRENGRENCMSLLAPEKKIILEIEKDSTIYLNVPEKLSKPHKLISGAQQNIRHNSGYQRGNMSRTSGESLRIIASKSNMPRAFRIMDTLIKAFIQRGHQVVLKNNLTFIVVFGEEFEVNLREKIKRVPKPSNYSWQEYDYVPTGKLAFIAKISWRNVEWKDGTVLLENQIARIIAKLEIKGEEERHATERRRAQQSIDEEKRKIEQELMHRKEKELVEFKTLLKNARRWHEAMFIRNYLSDLKSISKSGDNQKYLEWAEKKVNWYDPLIESDDELLQEVDRDSLILGNKYFN
ncbi:hypothetical protein CNR22_19650 [Sphingobacteriaceae bacterium]|nr:hypothetical protein CNR22_19650 [Sphingobacteriaceae bacterium]